MRVLVTGSSGFLGWHLVRHFESAGVEVHGTYVSNRPGFGRAEVHRLDIREAGECERLIAHLSPSHLIHTAALSQTGECDRDPALAHAINVKGTANLVRAAGALRSAAPHVVHLSTDLVFDGSRAPYDESATPNPIQEYGRTKLLAENEFAQACMPDLPRWTILRSALIYGAATPHHQSFLQWMLALLQGESSGKLFTDEFRSPIWVHDLCRAIELICHTGVTGLFHCGGNERLSRWEFGELVANVYGMELDANLRGTRVEHGVDAVRPADVTLDSSSLQRAIGSMPSACKDALKRVAELPFS